MKRRVLLVIIVAALLFQPAIMTSRAVTGGADSGEGYKGLDFDDDIKDVEINTGDATVDGILNFVLSIFTSAAEVFYDAFVKAPLLALTGAWVTVQNVLIGWGIAAPMAWSISTLLFVAVGVVIIWLLATATDWIM